MREVGRKFTKYEHAQSCDGVDFVAGKCEKIETTPNTNMFKVVMGSDLVTGNAGSH